MKLGLDDMGNVVHLSISHAREVLRCMVRRNGDENNPDFDRLTSVEIVAIRRVLGSKDRID